MFEVTLKNLRKSGACKDGYNRLVCSLSGQEFDEDRETYIRFKRDEPISILHILESNDLDDALWALQCVRGHTRDIRLYAVLCARQFEHLSDDPRVKRCNDVSERFADGKATAEELAAAWDAARAAAWAAEKNRQQAIFVSYLLESEGAE